MLGLVAVGFARLTYMYVHLSVCSMQLAPDVRMGRNNSGRGRRGDESARANARLRVDGHGITAVLHCDGGWRRDYQSVVLRVGVLIPLSS